MSEALGEAGTACHGIFPAREVVGSFHGLDYDARGDQDLQLLPGVPGERDPEDALAKVGAGVFEDRAEPSLSVRGVGNT